jgi:hypothetical protein
MTTLDDLLQSPSSAAKVQAALNVLLEAPYFYKTDDEDLFLFIRRHQKEFDAFLESHFGWQLVADAKCARVYKPRWYNESITPSKRDMFNFTTRNDCVAFMLLMEFFETKIEEEAIGIDDPDNLRFRFGNLLEFEHRRFQEIFPESAADYDDEDVRRILRNIMPVLERYRFILKIDPPADENINPDEVIYECLPALWHYNASALSRPVEPDSAFAAKTADNESEQDS